MLPLRLSGEIVERQTYLNGSRYYLIEGGGADGAPGWTFTLALTVPKEPGAPVAEGDLTLSHGQRSWFADVVGGEQRETFDEALDAAVVAVTLSLRRNAESGSEIEWLAAEAHLRLVSDGGELTVVSATRG